MDNGVITQVHEPSRQELGNVYRYIKTQIIKSGHVSTIITLSRFTQDLQDNKDQIQYNVFKLIAMGVLERKLITTKDNKHYHQYRLLK